MKKKYYAVKVGRKPGIYNSWEECSNNVSGYKNAVFKGFVTKEEAEKYMGKVNNIIQRVQTNDTTTGRSYAYVDGSFNEKTKTYGYGGFLCVNGKEYILQGSGNDSEMASMRNVAGEILGAIAAIQKAEDLGITVLDIYYDYQGIEAWATGNWKRNKNGTKMYKEIVDNTDIYITFKKVKGHSGIEGNERADALAKKAVGL